MHVEALFTHDARGRMCHVNELGGAMAPLFFLGLTAGGNEWRFRHDISDALRKELEARGEFQRLALRMHTLIASVSDGMKLIEAQQLRLVEARRAYAGAHERGVQGYDGAVADLLAARSHLDRSFTELSGTLEEPDSSRGDRGGDRRSVLCARAGNARVGRGGGTHRGA